MKKNISVMVLLLSAVVVVGMLSGCKTKPPIDVLTTDLEDSEPIEVSTGSGDGLPSSSLRPDSMATLRENADKIKQVPGVIIQVAGHCDGRGTQEYNLALGERRALAVRQYLIQLGVTGDRLITISYGKEFPAVMGDNESAWAKNRRAEFNRAR